MSESEELSAVTGRPQTQMDEIENTVAYFASMMRNKLYDNMHKGGWRKDATGPLLRRYMEESGELIEKIVAGLPMSEWEGEAADCANFLMMLIDPSRKP